MKGSPHWKEGADNMDVDKKIIETEEAVTQALNSSGLTLGIMQLILKDVLHIIQMQQMTQIHADDAGKEETE